jgi:two-component system, sensor histidine kinase YesM
MKSVDKLWKKSIFKSLMISFVCILLPIYILSILIYNWGIKTLRQEISNSMVDQVSNYLNGLELEIQRIQTLQHDCFSDDNLNRLAAIPEYMNDIEKMQSILRLQQRLSAIKNSSEYIYDVFVFIPAVDKKISATTYYDLDPKEHNTLKPVKLYSETKVMEIDGRMFLSSVYPYGSAKSEKGPIFTLVIELSKSKIENALNSMINTKDEGIILINKSNSSVISTKYDTEFNDKIQSLLTDRDTILSKNAERIKIGDRSYLAVHSVSNYLGDILCKYTPEDSVFKSLRRYQAWFILLTVVALAVIVTYSMYMYNFIHKPLSRLAKAFKQVENGDFSVPIEHEHDDEFRYIYRRFNAMVENVKELIDQVYKQRILAQKAELNQLQSQINPHFLYNSFFILNTMSIVGDYDNLRRFTEQLGEYFQFITRSAADEITLDKEVNHARVYTEIQMMRFSNRIRVEFADLPEEFSRLIVPRLILQPIIENAFEHGLEKKTSDGLLRISFLNANSQLCIIIEDNGEQLTDEDLEKLQTSLAEEESKSEITGIINVNQRIRLKFGAGSMLTVARGEMGGIKVTIRIKLTEGDHNVQAINR